MKPLGYVLEYDYWASCFALKENSIIRIKMDNFDFTRLCQMHHSVVSIDTMTLNLKTSPVAAFAGVFVFLGADMPTHHFKFGIKKEEKIIWSIPISFESTEKEINKIIKLKNYW